MIMPEELRSYRKKHFKVKVFNKPNWCYEGGRLLQLSFNKTQSQSLTLFKDEAEKIVKVLQAQLRKGW